MRRYKHPRTPHLPWGFGGTPDDLTRTLNEFDPEILVVTEKLDGQNVTIYQDCYVHARSVDDLVTNKLNQKE